MYKARKWPVFSRQQAGWPHQQSFKLDSGGKSRLNQIQRGSDLTLSEGGEPRNIVTLESNKEILVNCLKGIRKGSSEKDMQPIAQLNCLYSNAHSIGNKHEELETMLQLENYDLIVITETWWDQSYNQNTGIDNYKLFIQKVFHSFGKDL